MKVHPILFVIFVKFHHLNENKSFWFFSKGLVGGISMPRCKDGKKNAYRILGPLPTQFSSCDFIPEVRGGPDWQWSLGCPKWFRRRAWKGDVLKIQFPRGEEKFLSSREWVKWVFAFDGLSQPFICAKVLDLFLDGHVYDILLYYCIIINKYYRRYLLHMCYGLHKIYCGDVNL